MFEKNTIRVGQGQNIHLKFMGETLRVYYSDNNSSKSIDINLNNFSVSKNGINAYCDEIIPLENEKALYRIRNEIIIK